VIVALSKLFEPVLPHIWDVDEDWFSSPGPRVLNFHKAMQEPRTVATSLLYKQVVVVLCVQEKVSQKVASSINCKQ